MKTIPYLLLLIASLSCQNPSAKAQQAQWKQEIRETEQAFSNLSRQEGIAKAFLTYAAPDAVMLRGQQRIEGLEAIRTYFEAQTGQTEGMVLTWEPDFIDVSASGDLGYTYGAYTLTQTDSLGTTQTRKGVFHTVWKRQADGNWRFVWD
ncbi:DUF4440 domain-containing protein [Robiginitalea sp. M366]|uniref:YybH family protein n=1 Tax=Robiginitalea aestuariiviva TaxID=3036903 RepID=UPI00240D8D66|nr:DUF4440 domain-containing protein [Robiginitalea aestuariiviva]MDG1571929.1 DUF4440 domain-containing protein [Robiginitalea aestuariiviva]